jgi:prophage antirepressor-like protein
MMIQLNPMETEKVTRYSRGKIYEIVNDVNDKVYVGSTCNALRVRLRQIKNKPHSKKLKDAFAEIGEEHFRIILIEKYPCKDKDELLSREEYWRQRKNACYNSVACMVERPPKIPMPKSTSDVTIPASQLFKYQETSVRIVLRDGNPWFCAKDVCEALDIRNHRSAVAGLDDDEKMGIGTDDLKGRIQETGFINESGLYALIFRSRTEESKKFKKWVTSEVIPSARKAGQLSPDQLNFFKDKEKRLLEEKKQLQEDIDLLRAENKRIHEDDEPINNEPRRGLKERDPSSIRQCMSSITALVPFLNSDKILRLSAGAVTCRSSDGYVNLTELCKAGECEYRDWKRSKKSGPFLEALSDALQIPSTVLIAFQAGHGKDQITWGHPQIATEIAHWISPEFAVKISKWIYELAATGKVELGKEKDQKELDESWINKVKGIEDKLQSVTVDLLEERKERIRAQKNHSALAKKRSYHKMKKGSCFYVWHSPVTPTRHKIGITDDINERLRAERTCVPDLHLDYLCYIERPKLIEDSLLVKYREKLIEPNHEIVDVAFEKLAASLRGLLKWLGCEHTVEDELWKYNHAEPPAEVEEPKITSSPAVEAEKKEAPVTPPPKPIGPRMYPCLHAGCGKSFKRNDTLKAHVEQVHEKTTVTCPHCSKEIIKKYLKRHIDSVHGQAPKHKCRFCEQTFSQTCGARRHEKTHHSAEAAELDP